MPYDCFTKGDDLMQLRPSRAISSLALVLMISAVLGGLFGGQVRATTTAEEDTDNSIKLFSNLLGLVEGIKARKLIRTRLCMGRSTACCGLWIRIRNFSIPKHSHRCVKISVENIMVLESRSLPVSENSR